MKLFLAISALLLLDAFVSSSDLNDIPFIDDAESNGNGVPSRTANASAPDDDGEDLKPLGFLDKYSIATTSSSDAVDEEEKATSSEDSNHSTHSDDGSTPTVTFITRKVYAAEKSTSRTDPVVEFLKAISLSQKQQSTDSEIDDDTIEDKNNVTNDNEDAPQPSGATFFVEDIFGADLKEELSSTSNNLEAESSDGPTVTDTNPPASPSSNNTVWKTLTFKSNQPAHSGESTKTKTPTPLIPLHRDPSFPSLPPPKNKNTVRFSNVEKDHHLPPKKQSFISSLFTRLRFFIASLVNHVSTAIYSGIVLMYVDNFFSLFLAIILFLTILKTVMTNRGYMKAIDSAISVVIPYKLLWFSLNRDYEVPHGAVCAAILAALSLLITLSMVASHLYTWDYTIKNSVRHATLSLFLLSFFFGILPALVSAFVPAPYSKVLPYFYTVSSVLSLCLSTFGVTYLRSCNFRIYSPLLAVMATLVTLALICLSCMSLGYIGLIGEYLSALSKTPVNLS